MMKTFKIYLVVFALLIPFIGISKDEFPPKPERMFNDYTGNTLSPPQAHALEQELRKFYDSTSTQIAVVIMGSTGDYDIADYADRLGDKWGIGTKKKDNGILIVVAKDDHKMTIQIGYGLEAVIPDMIAKTIVDNEMEPAFKAGNFYLGLHNAVNTLMSLARKEFTADQYVKRIGNRGQGHSRPFPLFAIIILVIVAIVFLNRARTVSHYASMNNIGFWAAWMLLMNSGGGGGWNNFNSGGGGFGGFGGGSDSGDIDFGGFGGGSFGGGGASGSW
jgi:uncharacterized protein